MANEITIDMGQYQVECSKGKEKWRITDMYGSTVKEFDDLDDLLKWLRRELETIEIVGD